MKVKTLLLFLIDIQVLFNVSSILPLCLPSDTSATHANKMAIVAGWGNVVENVELPETPRHTNLTVITNTMCQLMHSSRNIIKRYLKLPVMPIVITHDYQISHLHLS